MPFVTELKLFVIELWPDCNDIVVEFSRFTLYNETIKEKEGSDGQPRSLQVDSKTEEPSPFSKEKEL